MRPLQIVLADDQALVRAGFAMVIRPQRDMVVAGEAADGAEAVEITQRLCPDLVLMDVRMPVLDGIEATRRIRRLGTQTRVLVLTTFDRDDYVVDALNAGASGFLLKDAGAGDLLSAIRSVCSGHAVVAPSATRRLLDRALPLPPADGGPSREAEHLSEREREVLTLIGQGASNAEIASALFVAESTVKSHVHSLLRKTQSRDRVHLVIRAHAYGLVPRQQG